jgi:hypothetical protein
MRGSWSFFRKLREAFRIDQAFLKSRHWLTSPQDLQYRKYILSQAMTNVKAFRRQITRGELSFEVISKRRASVYEAYAQAMNEIENWTGKLKKFETGQDIDTGIDYRFPTTAFIGE